MTTKTQDEPFIWRHPFLMLIAFAAAEVLGPLLFIAVIAAPVLLIDSLIGLH